jgi:phospholipase C
MSSRLPRREFIKGLGAATGLGTVGGLAGCKPGGDSDTAATPGSIDTIVLCMMENRSFDHVLGSLLLDEGRTDVDGLLASHQNPGPDGEAVYVRNGSGTCVDPDPPHGWNSSRTALANGTNLGFVQSYVNSNGREIDYTQVMGYLSRAQAPITHAFADRYAVANRWFSSIAAPTWPNRLYAHGAQSQGQTSNDLPDGTFFSMLTIWDQLDEAGIPWSYYYTDLPMLGLFGRFNGRLKKIEEFFADAEAGTLAPVVMVEPGAALNDDHPPHHPMLGQVFLGTIHNALAASPQWNRSLFALAYDEAGGFFDHVVPGTAPDDRADQGFDQLGFRVPAVVMGPYAKQGAIDTACDHTSWLTHIQRIYGLDPLTARDAAANDLTDFIDADRLTRGDAAAPAELPVISLSQDEILAQCDDRARMPSGQPELEALIRATAPELDRMADLPAIGRFLFDKAVELGVVLPI